MAPRTCVVCRHLWEKMLLDSLASPSSHLFGPDWTLHHSYKSRRRKINIEAPTAKSM